MFDNLSRIGDVRCPVFILHGEKDPLVPVWGARVLYKYFQRMWESVKKKYRYKIVIVVYLNIYYSLKLDIIIQNMY